ncbi:MAG: hypothetical protein P4L42_04560 [Desulfocapsaceae bacterium]|nr:hypothetical protein [Desulfocapsaceae bacterium]
MRRVKQYCSVVILAASLILGATAVSAHERANTACTMTFAMKGWSALYQTASGHGSIRCTNGQSSRVRLNMRGGGLTAGQYKVRGKGDFTGVQNISDIYGAYVATDAHAGVVKSGNAQVMTKGTVSLAIASKGEGIDIGVGISRFVIQPAGAKKK